MGNFFVAFISEVNPFSNDVAMYFFYAGLMVMFDILFGLINWNYTYRTQMAAGTADVEASTPSDMGIEMDEMPEELPDDDGKGGAFQEDESTLADAYGNGKDHHGAYAAEDFAHGQYEEAGTYTAHSTQTAYGGEGAYGGGAYGGGEYGEGVTGSYAQAHGGGEVGVHVQEGGAADGEWNGFDDDL